MKEKMFSIEVPYKHEALYTGQQKQIDPRTIDCRSEAVGIQNIRDRLAFFSVDKPKLSPETKPKAEPESKIKKIVKEVWERIKAAGRALIAPEEEKAVFHANPIYSPAYQYILVSTMEKAEKNPLEMIIEIIGRIVKRIVKAGKALFKPRFCTTR
jgi:hypothetical protein